MEERYPPDFLVNHLVAKIQELNQDIDKWEYRNPFYDPPSAVFCPHCDQSMESVVKLYKVCGDKNDEYVFGHCKKCSRVYWTEVAEV